MRLVLLCPDVSSNALVRTYPIAKVLARHHEVRLAGFAFGDGVFGPYRDEFEYDYLQGRPLPAFLLQVRELARRLRADALYVFKPLPSSLWVGLWARRRLGIPVFLDVEDWETAWYRDSPVSDALRHLAHLERPDGLAWIWLAERMVRWADHVFVVSRFLQRKFGGTLLVHGADTSVFDPARCDTAAARARIGLSPGRYVVFTGTPTPNKGLEDLLEAVGRVGDPQLRVLIVGAFRGDPGYQERLLARYGSHLEVVGPRPHAEMPLYLAAADVVALPQRLSRVTMAQVPGKVFEAMAMARPILATAVSDLPAILEGCGVVVPPGSIDALAAGLDGLLVRPDEAGHLGREARRRCEQLYSWDAMESVLEGVLGRWSAGETGAVDSIVRGSL